MIGFRLGKAYLGAAVIGVSLLAACAPKAPPPPPPPPPAPVEIIPYRPLPPSGATYIMAIPSRGSDGRHVTPLRNITDDERVWFFRSAWNVAALNCIGPGYEPILTGYAAFLKDNAKALKAINTRIDQATRKKQSSRDAMMSREKSMTIVYNYFALPPARDQFCQTALRMASLTAATPKPDAATLAAAHFVEWERPFENFFTAYEQYQRDSAAWDQRYGARYGASQPGYLAVQAARALTLPQVGQANPASTTLQSAGQAGVVIDQETGASIPIVPVTPGQEAVPVVQPVEQTAPMAGLKAKP